MTLRASVIVPSYNRRVILERVLEGLAAQRCPRDAFEVVVILDGNTDDSEAMLGTWAAAERLHRLRWRRQPNAGQAVARNTGAELAESDLLIFLDDDIVPEPVLVAVHLDRHERERGLVVLGDCPIVRNEDESLYHLGVWAWWEDYYHARAAAGHAVSYRDFASGNFSIRRDDLRSVGGFDAGFRGYGGEDFELGYRLLMAGVRLVAEPAARALHHHRTTVAGVMRNTRQEAHGDHRMAQLHPELARGLRLSRPPAGGFGRWVRLMMACPWLTDPVASAVRLTLAPLEKMGLRTRWRKNFDFVRGYAYWRGVRDTFGSWAAMRAFQRGVGAAPEHEIDLTHGLPDPLPELWTHGPARIACVFRGQRIGVVELDGRYDSWEPLRVRLAREVEKQLGPALACFLLADAMPAPRGASEPIGASHVAPADASPRLVGLT